MGVHIGAKLIYGCVYDNLADEDLEEIDELLDSGELDYASPYYDAPRSQWVIGIEVHCNGLDAEGIGYAVNDAELYLPKILKNDYSCSLYVCPDVY